MSLKRQALSSGVVTIQGVPRAGYVKGATLELSQLSRGACTGRLLKIDTQNATLTAGQYSQRIGGFGNTASGEYMLAYISKIHGVGQLNGHHLARRIWVYPEKEQIEGTLPPSTHRFTLTINRDAFEDRLEALGIDPALLIRIGGGRIRQTDKLPALARTLQRLNLEGQHQTILGTSESIEETLALSFIDAIPNPKFIQEPGTTIRPSVKKAIEFLRSVTDRPITATEICRHLNCSRRQVELEFKNIFGMGPVSYHRAMRLNAARAQLILREQPRNPVASAAGSHGFSHFGRFSALYKLFFGELPCRTAMRTHSA